MVDRVLRVLTANLYNGKAAIGPLQKVLERERPDIAAFQELDPAQARVVERHFPHGRLDPRRDHHGMGVAAIHPIAVDRFPMTHRDGWRAMLSPRSWEDMERDIELLNIHIQNPLMLPLRATARNRRGQVDDLLRYVTENRTTRIVVGDMNASPAWKVYKRIAAQLQDAALAAATPAPTWSYFSWTPRMLRIDHIFVDGLVALETRVAKLKGSDHSAVVADLQVD